MKTYLVTLRQKPTSVLGSYTSLFLVREDTTRKDFVNFIRNHDDEIDLRTAKWEEFDNSGRTIDLKVLIVPIESQVGTVTLA